MKTFERDGIKITLHLNQGESVNLKRKMIVEHGDETYEMYPDAGTVEHQFEYVKTSIRFDKAYDATLLKSTRKALGLTQTQMAERLGYAHQKEVSNIETGKENMGNQARAHLLTILKYEVKND